MELVDDILELFRGNAGSLISKFDGKLLYVQMIPLGLLLQLIDFEHDNVFQSRYICTFVLFHRFVSYISLSSKSHAQTLKEGAVLKYSYAPCLKSSGIRLSPTSIKFNNCGVLPPSSLHIGHSIPAPAA